MHIYNLMMQYWDDIALVVIFVIVMVILVKNGKKTLVQRIVYALVVEAEKVLGSGTGAEKKAWAIAAIYQRLPYLLRLIFSQKDIESFIEDGVQKLKKALQTGEINLLGYSEELILKQPEWQDPENIIK